MDTFKMSENRRILLKVAWQRLHPLESGVECFLSGKPLTDYPENHCVPIMDVLKSPLYYGLEFIGANAAPSRFRRSFLH